MAWTTGTAAPSGGNDGDSYTRLGSVAPGVYYNTGGVWALVLATQAPVDLSVASRRVTPTLAHDLILGDLTQAVGARGGVASVQALKGLIGGFSPTLIGSATVSAQVSTWRATNIDIPVAGQWFLLRVDLPIHRGFYLLHGGQWRGLSVAAAGGNPTEAQSIPLAGGYFHDVLYLLRAGRVGGDSLLIGYDGGRSGEGNYNVELFQL